MKFNLSLFNLHSGRVRRAATNPPAQSGRHVLHGSMQTRIVRAAGRGTNSSQREEFHPAKHVCTTSSTPLNAARGIQGKVFALALLAPLTLFAQPAFAGLPEPDNVLYGSIALDGQLVTSNRTDVVVEARRTLNGPAIARYRMGSNARFQNFYSLRLSLESLPPVTDTNASQAGQPLILVVTDLSGAFVQATNSVLVGDRGTVRRVDFGVLTNLTGFAAWELAQGLPPGSGNLDSDGDGVSNTDEYISGTNPLDPNSKFALSIQSSAGAITVSFAARRAEGPGYEGSSRYYSLERNTNQPLVAWFGIPAYTNLFGNNTTVTYPETGTNSPTFYRARVRLQSSP